MRTTRTLLASSLTAAALVACASPDETDVEPVERAAPSPGSPGLGDSLFPTLGNGGYDVLHYDLALRYETADPAQPLDGTVSIVAQATQALSQFDLDFGGDDLADVLI